MLTNIELGKYLNKIRKDKKISLREVEKLTNIGYAHLSMIENGKRNFTPSLLKKLANLYNIDYLDLYEKAGYIDLIENEQKEKFKSIYACPVYSKINTIKPNWEEECIKGRIPINYSLIDIVNPEECFFLYIEDESMNKVIKNGAYALIRKQNMVENGEIAVVLINGFDATLKKFSKQGDLIVLEPMSNNTNFQLQIYDKNSCIKILGKYIGKFEMNK